MMGQSLAVKRFLRSTRGNVYKTDTIRRPTIVRTSRSSRPAYLQLEQSILTPHHYNRLLVIYHGCRRGRWRNWQCWQDNCRGFQSRWNSRSDCNRPQSKFLKATDIRNGISDNTKVPEGEQPVPTFAVDYGNVDKITQTLKEHKVHTVVSSIVMYDPVAAQSERNLIQAAAKSATVKRFVQSNWGDKTPEDESVTLRPL
jgi:hypothetical protein